MVNKIGKKTQGKPEVLGNTFSDDTIQANHCKDLLMQSQVILFAVLDTQGRVLHINQAGRHMLGLSTRPDGGELIFVEHIEPADQIIWKEELNNSLKMGSAWARVRIQNSNPLRKGPLWLAVELLTAYNKEAQKKFIYVSGYEVSEQHQTTFSAIEYTQKLDEILQNINGGFINTDSSLKIIYVNAEAQRILNKRPEEILNLTLLQALHGIVPDSAIRKLRNRKNTISSVPFEYFLKPRKIWLKGIIFENDEGISVYFNDVTAERRAIRQTKLTEQVLDASLRSTQTSYVLLDSNHCILAFTDGLEKRLNEEYNINLVKGSDLRKLVSHKNLTKYNNCFNSALKGRAVSWEKEGGLAEINSVWYLMNFWPVFDAQGQISGVALTSQNISELKRTSTIVMKQEQVLADISYKQSHHVRGPVATLLGLLMLLKPEQMNDEQKHIFGLMQNTTEKLDRVIKEIVHQTYQPEHTK
jgi:PAS domain-containing protein